MQLIIIHVFQMYINCLLMKYYVNVLIIINVFQMDIICVLMKYYFMFTFIIHGILWTLFAF